MLEEPNGSDIEQIIELDWLRKYVLKETRYCEYCESDTACVLWSHREIDYWYVLACWECDGIEQKVHKRQHMPFCEKCNESFKMSGDEVLMQVYDETGDRICSDCIKEYLKDIQKQVEA